MSDPYEILAEQVAARVSEGRRPTKAQAEWLAILHPQAQAQSSVSGTRNAKGEMQFDVKVYDADPYEAARIMREIADSLRGAYPMSDGTTGKTTNPDAPTPTGKAKT